jgi:hypothetical protein
MGRPDASHRAMTDESARNFTKRTEGQSEMAFSPTASNYSSQIARARIRMLSKFRQTN